MLKSYGIILLCITLFSSNFIFGQVLGQTISAGHLTVIRIFCVTLLFVIWGFFSKSYARLTVRHAFLLFFMGLLGTVLYQIMLFKGLKTTSATTSSLIFGLGPLCTSLLAFILLKEKITYRMVSGALLTFAGLYIALQKGGSYHFQIGDLYIAGAMFLFSTNLIFYRTLARKLPALTIMLYSFMFSFLISWPAVMGDPGFWRITPAEWGLAAFSAVFSQGLGGLLWNREMNKVGAAKASVFLNLQPLIVMLLSLVFLHTPVTLQQLSGSVLVIGGVAISSLQQIKFKPSALNKSRFTGGENQDERMDQGYSGS